MKESAKVELESYGSLFGDGMPEGKKSGDADIVHYIETNKLKTFRNHPFSVKADKDMRMLEASIRENGILNPILVRPLGDDTYEIISGHRRRQVAMTVGIRKVPVIIREMDDDTAAIEVVNANKQRKNMSIREKARAYTLEFNALQHRGRPGEHTLTLMKNIHGDSERNIQRYMLLMKLPESMWELIDKKEIKFVPAVTVSQIDKEYLEIIATCVIDGKKLTLKKAERIQTMHRYKKLTTDKIVEVMESIEEPKKDMIKIDYKKIKDYFPRYFGRDDAQEFIEIALEFWYESYNPEGVEDK